MIPLKYLNNFKRTLDMSLINCEIDFQLKLSANCFLAADTVANQEPKFTMKRQCKDNARQCKTTWTIRILF